MRASGLQRLRMLDITKLWLTLPLIAALAFAGCVAPDESGMGDDLPPTDDNSTMPPDSSDLTLADRALIGDAVYVCEDEAAMDPDATATTNEGACQRYAHDADAQADGTEKEATMNADGSVTIGGETYTCEATGGDGTTPCAAYVHHASA